MARILFLPLFLIILALAVYLLFRLKTMFSLSKSKDITLSRPSPYGGDVRELTGAMLAALNNMPSVQYQSEIHVNYRKITAFSKTGSGSGYSKITGRSATVEITRENGSLLVKTGKSVQKQINRNNRWVDFWCGVSTLEESMDLFSREGMKAAAGDMGAFMQRNYVEILIVSHALSPGAGQAFGMCAPFLGKVYGKNLSEPGVGIRNFMMRLLVNSLTSLPDYVEIKYNIFRGNEFICDYLQNSRLLY
ncbi:MAG: hypothetical protein K6T66_08460 [Peptococcaceae bacterium]|nr:hypothetical protein [Peptococcaceae bacterium]